MHKFALIVALLLLAAGAGAEPHERMMKATFKIVGDSKKLEGSEETAVAFAVSLDSSRPSERRRRIALLTARHFFDNIQGERIDLIARESFYDGSYQRVTHRIHLQEGDTKKIDDKSLDAALVVIDWPFRGEVAPLTLDQFATTDVLGTMLYPGRAVFSVGYPFGIESSDAGFAILRHGYVASYPPPRKNDQLSFLVDMSMSQGFSGSPIYIPEYRGGRFDYSSPLILGMIIGQRELASEFKGPFESRTVRYPLDLAVVTHAAALRKLIQRAKEE